jgi:tetratricopeptide (TPR) repeat protein
MSGVHFARALAIQAVAVSLIVGACTPQSATPPATGPGGTNSPPTTCNLDPALSDAGVVGCVTLANDLAGSRDGTYDIIGVAADASSCSVSFDGSEFTAVARNQSVPTGKVSRLSVTVPTGSMQQVEGGSGDISGRVSFDFDGAFPGSTYTGDASQDDGQSTIAIEWAAGRLTFDFTGVTAANGVFSGKVVCLVTGPSPSPGGSGGETPIISFSDPSALDEDSWDAYQPLLERACRNAQPDDQPSFAQAIADVRGWLDSATGGGLSALEASGEFADEAIASAGAAELVTGGDFAAALALTLQANRAEPDDPRHLVNAAGLLVALDRPTDALAFLDQAAKMRSPDVTPMGIDQGAVALTNRGVALSAQGRYTEAAGALRSSLAADPNLTEAADNLAQAEVCLGNGRAAFARVSQRRIDQIPRLPEGRPGTLPDLKLPARPADTVALSELYQQLVDQSIDRLLARMQRQQSLEAEGQTRYEAPANLARVESIRNLIARAEGLPEIEALWVEVTAREEEVSRITFDMWGTAGAFERKSDECGASMDKWEQCLRAWCVPETQHRHAQWRGAFDSYETALRDAYAALGQRETALAGLVADPVWFELVSLDIQDTADRWFYSYLAGEALGWSRLTAVNASLCIEAEGEEDAGTPPEEPRSEAAPCDPQSFPNGLMPMIRFPGGLKLGANCEEIMAEVTGTGIDPFGLLRPFAQIKGTGKGVTVFAGLKAGITMEPVSLSGKLGVYWTVDYQGNVRDYGVRIAPGSAGIETGPFGIRVWEAEAMDFSFVGITDSMPLIGTQ